MRPSPLLLERHFFTRIEIVTHLDAHPGSRNALVCKIDIGRDTSQPKRFRVDLGIRLEAAQESKPAYTGEVCAVGIFKVADNYPAENMESLVNANGPAVLFGAIREMVLNLTARGPWPPVVLETFTFVNPAGNPYPGPAKVKQTAKSGHRLQGKSASASLTAK